MIKDPNMLLSIINTKLRDFYESLEDLCEDLDYDVEEINEILNNNGFYYNKDKNQFEAKELLWALIFYN